jgi:hypothetical protein
MPGNHAAIGEHKDTCRFFGISGKIRDAAVQFLHT